MKPLPIAPNIPLTVALQDPEGRFDFETGMGQYQTITGELLTLPRPAVVALNTLDPQPGEEITICKHWSGKPGEKSEWTITLSPRAENARAEAEKLTQDPAEGMGTVESLIPTGKAVVAPPTPIRRPVRSRPPVEVQPRLFDRGTGTHGPAPLPQLAPAARLRPGQIPANIATREILGFIQSDPNTANWSDQARQDLASTILIASFKAGYIGLWERQS